MIPEREFRIQLLAPRERVLFKSNPSEELVYEVVSLNGDRAVIRQITTETIDDDFEDRKYEGENLEVSASELISYDLGMEAMDSILGD